MSILNKYLIIYNSKVPALAQFVIFAIGFLYLYYFYLFIIRKDNKYKLVLTQSVAFFIFFYLFYLGNKHFRSLANMSFINYNNVTEFIDTYCSPILLKLSYYTCLLSIVVLPIHLIIKKFIKPKTNLKHGAMFSPPKYKDNQGLNVGKFDTNILPKHIRNFQKKSNINIIIPHDKLSRTTTIIGSMGSGKTGLMRGIYEDIQTKYPTIPNFIHDPKGDWLRLYYNPETDIIFAPHDKRSVGWSIWEDMQKYPYLKHSLISTAVEAHHSGTTDKFWTNTATVLLKEVFSESNIEKAKAYLIGKRKENEDDKTFLSTYNTALMGFRDIASIELASLDPKKKKVSIEDLINHKGRIFLLNNPAYAKEQEGAFNLMLTALLLELVSRPDVSNSEDLRAFMLLDEALTFKLPVEVEKAIFTQCRSKGISIIASAQQLPQKKDADWVSWANNSANTFVMQLVDIPTRKAFSEKLGNMIYKEKNQSVSKGKQGSSTTESFHTQKHATLAPEDFGNLKFREFVLFYDNGVAVGKTKEVKGIQNRDVETRNYDERLDVVEFMKGL